jgi:hypothetical protein
VAGFVKAQPGKEFAHEKNFTFRGKSRSAWQQAPHPRLIKSGLPVERGRAQPATRSLLFFGAGRGKRKKTFAKPRMLDYALLLESPWIRYS